MVSYKKRFTKGARRFAKKTGKAVKTRYFKGKGYGKPKLMAMARDVAKLKHLLNVEKKVLTIEERTPIRMGLTVGSTKTSASITGEAIYAQRDNVLRSGAYVQPNLLGDLPAGSSNGQMVGDRLKFVSYHMDLRVKSIEADNDTFGKQTTKVHVYLVLIPRPAAIQPTTTRNQEEQLLSRFFEPSVFDSTYDGTRRNIEHMQDFKVLNKRTIYFNHNEDNDSVLTTTRIDGVKEFTMGGKLDLHQRWDGPGGDLIKNQVAMICIPDSGSITGTPTEGCQYSLEHSCKFYYVDN